MATRRAQPKPAPQKAGPKSASKTAAPHLALLRAVNVGGTGKVTMEALRGMLESLGFSQVRSLLQTGNLVFSGAGGSDVELEKQLEAACAKKLGLTTQVLVRSSDEWRAIVEGNPFPNEAKSDPGHLIVMPLRDAPTTSAVEALRAAIVGREQIAVSGRTLYATYPDGSGRSKLTLGLIERKLGTRATGRNWNTVLKLAKMIDEAP